MLGDEAKYTPYLYVHTNSKTQASHIHPCTAHTPLIKGEVGLVPLKHKFCTKLSTPIPAVSHPANNCLHDYVILYDNYY